MTNFVVSVHPFSIPVDTLIGFYFSLVLLFTTVQYPTLHTVQYNMRVQYSTVPYSKYSAVQYSTVQWPTLHTVQYNTVQYSALL